MGRSAAQLLNENSVAVQFSQSSLRDRGTCCDMAARFSREVCLPNSILLQKATLSIKWLDLVAEFADILMKHGLKTCLGSQRIFNFGCQGKKICLFPQDNLASLILLILFIKQGRQGGKLLDVIDLTANRISCSYVWKCIAMFYTLCCRWEELLSIHFKTWRCNVAGGRFWLRFWHCWCSVAQIDVFYFYIAGGGGGGYSCCPQIFRILGGTCCFVFLDSWGDAVCFLCLSDMLDMIICVSNNQWQTRQTCQKCSFQTQVFNWMPQFLNIVQFSVVKISAANFANTIFQQHLDIAKWKCKHSFINVRMRCLFLKMEHLTQVEVRHPSGLVAQPPAYFLSPCAFVSIALIGWVLSIFLKSRDGRIQIVIVFANMHDIFGDVRNELTLWLTTISWKHPSHYVIFIGPSVRLNVFFLSFTPSAAMWPSSAIAVWLGGPILPYLAIVRR